MKNSPTSKLYYSVLLCLILFPAFKWMKSDYTTLFSEAKINPVSYDEIYLMHFDFCSSVTKCRDTVEMEAFFTNPKKRVALIIDTLYNAEIPGYLKLDKSNVFYVNRIWLQRRGLYTEYQQKLIISSKGKFKKRIILK